jgi:small basic protein
MGRQDNVNARQVVAGCFTFILIAVVLAIVGEASGVKAFLGIIAIIAIFILGAFLTGAFKD